MMLHSPSALNIVARMNPERMHLRRVCLASVVAVCLSLSVGCADGGLDDAGASPEATEPEADAGSLNGDGGTPSDDDAGTPSDDAGAPAGDAGTPSDDAGAANDDAGAPAGDAGTPNDDAGTQDGGTPVDGGVLFFSPCVITTVDGEGTLQARSTATFTNGRQESTLTEFGIAGIAPTRTDYFYDANGRLASTETDQGDDGSVETISVYEYAGDMIITVTTTTTNGATTTTIEYTYENGIPASYTYDFDGDGEPDLRSESTFDSEGRVIRIETDNNNDGTVDGVTVISYEVTGNVTVESRDSDNDGNIDSRTTTTTNAAGRTQEVLTEFFFQGVPSTLTLATYSYDAAGRLAEVRSDANQDGISDVSDSVTTYDYSCHD